MYGYISASEILELESLSSSHLTGLLRTIAAFGWSLSVFLYCASTRRLYHFRVFRSIHRVLDRESCFVYFSTSTFLLVGHVLSKCIQTPQVVYS